MTKLLSILEDWFVGPQRMNAKERKANIDGLNIVFGAVLGFVLAATENMGTYDFSIILFYSATIVVTILYVTHSRFKWAYMAISFVAVATLPLAMERVFIEATSQIPEKLQPTFAVWWAMSILMEIWPRATEEGAPVIDPSSK